MRFALTACLVSLAALLCACSSVRPPEIGVLEAQGSRSDAGVLLLITIKADNPNADPLPLREVRYTVSVDTQTVFKGVRSAEATLRRYGSREIVLPVALPLSSPGAIETGRFRVTGQLAYREPGAFAQTLLDVELTDPAVSFQGEGDFSVTESVAPLPTEPPETAKPATQP